MHAEWLLLLAGLAQPVLLVVLVPRRWLRRAMLAWLLLPVPILLAVLAREVATRPQPPDFGRNLLFGLELIAATYGVAWVLASGLAFAIGIGLRRLVRPGEKAPPPPPPRPAAALRRTPPHRRPAWTPGLPAGAPEEVVAAPDGRIAVRLGIVEWAKDAWVRAPRVEDRGRVVLDLWGSDWDAAVGFPGPGQVSLGLRPYRGGGAWTMVLDLDLGRAELREATGHGGGAAPESVPLPEAAARLEALAAARLATTEAVLGPVPHPLAAWRTALALLVLAAAATAGLVALTPERPRPAFTPPPIPVPPGVTAPGITPPAFVPPR